MRFYLFCLKLAMLAFFIAGAIFIKGDAPLIGAISFFVAAFFGHLIIKSGNKSIKAK